MSEDNEGNYQMVYKKCKIGYGKTHFKETGMIIIINSIHPWFIFCSNQGTKDPMLLGKGVLAQPQKW